MYTCRQIDHLVANFAHSSHRMRRRHCLHRSEFPLLMPSRSNYFRVYTCRTSQRPQTFLWKVNKQTNANSTIWWFFLNLRQKRFDRSCAYTSEQWHSLKVNSWESHQKACTIIKWSARVEVVRLVSMPTICPQYGLIMSHLMLQWQTVYYKHQSFVCVLTAHYSKQT